MSESNLHKVANELNLDLAKVKASASLLDEGATVPFIARYRKEATGSLDEVAILAIRDRLHQLRELDARREAIVKSLDERGLLSPELETDIQDAPTMAALEDIYLPYRPKRKTKASKAKERGLEPLALEIWAQEPGMDPQTRAQEFVDPEKEVADAEEALAGARDIMAEMINEDAGARSEMRRFYEKKAVFSSKVIKGEEQAGVKFKDYFDWSEPAMAAAGHRILAMRRGEKEGHLMLRVQPPAEDAIALLEGKFIKGDGPASVQVGLAIADGYKRLLGPAMETELRLVTKKKAEAEAVKVFAENLRELLLAPPLGQKRVMGVDPGLRTGCKLACLDRQGNLLKWDTFKILTEKERAEAAVKIKALCQEYRIEAVAVGNGTGGRETEALLRGVELPGITVVMVSESGASVYSASEVARDEFPDLDLTIRGAVSIGRRLTDPLAELVKIDPKAIGVGQYQHDVDQGDLKRSLDDVVVSCVNAVGVEVNTASPQLLSHVSGLGPALASNLVKHRQENGPFGNRKDLLEVPRLGPKAFELAAGFLRIRKGDNPLDASAVHPESYGLVKDMAAEIGCQIADLLKDSGLRSRIDPQRYVSDTVGLPTINDILAELEKPGRDPRKAFESFAFAEGVSTPEDLEPGMRLPGVVTNVTNFGAFVDVGVHLDGLVHISQLSDHFVSDPRQEVKVNQKVMVTVLEVDLVRNRIGLSMRQNPETQRGGKQPGKDQNPQKTSRPKKPRAPQPSPRKNAPFNNAFAEALKGRKFS